MIRARSARSTIRRRRTALIANFGTGTLCAQCHQARPNDDGAPSIGGDPVTVTSSRYGTHYSPVAEVMLGLGL